MTLKSKIQSSSEVKSADLDELSPAVQPRTALDPNEHQKISNIDFNSDKTFQNLIESKRDLSRSTRLDELIIPVPVSRS